MAAWGSLTHLPSNSDACPVNKSYKFTDSPGLTSLESNCGSLLGPHKERIFVVYLSKGKAFSQIANQHTSAFRSGGAPKPSGK